MKNVVEFVEFSRESRVLESKERFEFRKDRRFKWLQSACFFMLRKIGAYARWNECTIKRHRIDAEDFVVRLLRQKSSLVFEHSFTPTRVLMGAEDYAALMTCDLMNVYFEFDTSYRVESRGGGKSIIGLKVEVIPWMSGILAMP